MQGVTAESELSLFEFGESNRRGYWHRARGSQFHAGDDIRSWPPSTRNHNSAPTTIALEDLDDEVTSHRRPKSTGSAALGSPLMMNGFEDSSYRLIIVIRDIDSCMNHIEFVGPAGAGKTTIQTKLRESTRRYYGVPDGVCRRMLHNGAPPKYRWAYRVLPGPAQSWLADRVLSPLYRRTAVTRFLESHSDVFHASMAGVGAARCDVSYLTTYAMRVLERYAMGMMTVREDERLCLDENFAMLGHAIETRLPAEEYSIATFFEHTPTPAVLIHVDAPSDLCLERQRDRGRVSVKPIKEGETILDAQERAREVAKRVADIQADRTAVISVTNTGEIDEAVSRIKTELASAQGRSRMRRPPFKQRYYSTTGQLQG